MARDIINQGSAGGSVDPPDKWSCDAPSKMVRVRVQQPGGGFVEIPTSNVEQWITKGEAARIQRTAKVEHPTEWSGASVATAVQPMQWAEIEYRFEYDRGDVWVPQHTGWIGGVGNKNELESKFWIYDAAEMLKAIPVGIQFEDPSAQDVLAKIARSIDEETPIDLDRSVYVEPDDAPDTVTYTASETTANIKRGRPPLYGVDRSDILESNNFKPNHDSMSDVVDWFESKTSSKVHFEPSGGGSLTLIADSAPTRRGFEQDVLDGDVGLVENNALYEVNPVNAVIVRGEVGSGSYEGQPDATSEDRGPSSTSVEKEEPSREYPVAKAYSPPLVDAAEGELRSVVVESDATTLDQAEREAIEELSGELEGSSEGEIFTVGHPYLMPFDSLTAFETCGDNIAFEPNPVEYEIETVKHRVTPRDETGMKAEPFQTRLKVSIWANETTIETESEMVTMETE